MKDELISLYIDDELNLDQKIEFVATVHDDRVFTDETLALLRQEQRVRRELVLPGLLPDVPPNPVVKEAHGWFLPPWLRPVAVLATALLIVGAIFTFHPRQPALLPSQNMLYRFVVYLPQSSQAKIVGTFTDWKPVSMEQVGTSGYWTLTMPVSGGEHRYSYLIEDGRQIADPTVLTREQDDFGGENSVIEVRFAI